MNEILHKVKTKVKKITSNQKIIVLAILVILGIFCFYKRNTIPKNQINNTTKIETADSDIPASEYIPSEASSGTDERLNDAAILGITAVSPNKGFETGLKEYTRLNWRTNKIEEKKERISIDVAYPHFLGGTTVTKLNEYIENYIQNIIQVDRKKLKDAVGNDPDSFESTLDLSVVYRLIGVKNGIVSLEMVATDFTGGGNGNHDTPIIINWDLKKNALVKTSELFCSKDYLSTIKPLTRDALLVDIKKNPNVEVDFDKAKPVIEDGTSDSSNYEDIMPYKNGVIIVFSPYTILSGVFGILRVYIPDVGNTLCLP